MLNENGHLIFFSEHPPNGNPAYAYVHIRSLCIICIKIGCGISVMTYRQTIECDNGLHESKKMLILRIKIHYILEYFPLLLWIFFFFQAYYWETSKDSWLFLLAENRLNHNNYFYFFELCYLRISLKVTDIQYSTVWDEKFDTKTNYKKHMQHFFFPFFLTYIIIKLKLYSWEVTYAS